MIEIFVGFDGKWYDPDWTNAFQGILDKIEKKSNLKEKKIYTEYNPVTHVPNKNLIVHYQLEDGIYKIRKITLNSQ